MTYSSTFSSPSANHSDPNPAVPWLIGGLFSIVIVLELFTLADYVFSYFYIGPILLSNLRLNRSIAVRLTWLASALTLINLWIPGSHIITPSTVGNRLIAVIALVVTEILSSRNRYFEEAIAQQKVKLQFQEKLASLREDFTSTLTHDLKTPLIGAIETLKAFQQERFGTITALQQNVLSTMVRSHQSSLQLVETLLDIYRNDSEGVPLEQSPVNLIPITEQVVATLSDFAVSYQVSIQTNYQEKNLWVHGDALHLQRVLSNLLINAINHSPTNSRVNVHLESQWHQNILQHVIKVLDEGPGITEEELPQLFERFYQGRSNRQAKGSGLGLYLTRQIVEAHGGTIWAENRVPRGALFGCRIPAYSPFLV